MTRIAKPSGRPHNGQLSTLDVPPRLGHVAIVTVRPSTSPAVRRPGIIMQRRADGSFGVMTFTVAAHTLDGVARPAVLWQENGLNQPCYLFSRRLVIIPPHDVRGIVSVATPGLVEQCIDFLQWDEDRARELRESRTMAAVLKGQGIA